jgi:hypothetical protein
MVFKMNVQPQLCYLNYKTSAFYQNLQGLFTGGFVLPKGI